ncbi:MAG: hypothetical protein U0792_24110 [Gemmataceae bacterium]
MRWRMAVFESREQRQWLDCPTVADRHTLLAAARRLPAGWVLAEMPSDAERMDTEGMYLAFDQELGLLIRYGYREILRVVFPHRPPLPAEPSDWAGLRPEDLLASHGYPRAEAFGLLRQYVATGELPSEVPRPTAEQARLPGLEEDTRPDEWWRVEWVLAGVV